MGEMMVVAARLRCDENPVIGAKCAMKITDEGK